MRSLAGPRQHPRAKGQCAAWWQELASLLCQPGTHWRDVQATRSSGWQEKSSHAVGRKVLEGSPVPAMLLESGRCPMGSPGFPHLGSPAKRWENLGSKSLQSLVTLQYRGLDASTGAIHAPWRSRVRPVAEGERDPHPKASWPALLLPYLDQADSLQALCIAPHGLQFLEDGVDHLGTSWSSWEPLVLGTHGRVSHPYQQDWGQLDDPGAQQHAVALLPLPCHVLCPHLPDDALEWQLGPRAVEVPQQQGHAVAQGNQGQLGSCQLQDLLLVGGT